MIVGNTEYERSIAMRSEQGLANAARSKREYDKTNAKTFSLKFNVKTDADILELFETIDNKQGYIKRLIREDIARNATKKQLYVANSWTGAFIEPVSSLNEGLRLIEQFENRDREDGTFREDFYTIVDQDHVSIL